MVIGLTERQWRGLVKATGIAPEIDALAERLGLDLREEGNRYRARHAITAILRPWFAARRVTDFAETFDAAGLTWSEFRSFAEAVRLDPDLSTENPMFDRRGSARHRRLSRARHPVRFSAVPREAPVRAPALGEHTEAILADVLGLGSGQIARLFDRGVVAGPRSA
jgi:2-methylfumaryl-CoA isomerase